MTKIQHYKTHKIHGKTKNAIGKYNTSYKYDGVQEIKKIESGKIRAKPEQSPCVIPI